MAFRYYHEVFKVAAVDAVGIGKIRLDSDYFLKLNNSKIIGTCFFYIGGKFAECRYLSILYYKLSKFRCWTNYRYNY